MPVASSNKSINKSAQTELRIMSFETAKQWENWLAKNYDIKDGVWLRIQKKDSKEKSVAYNEALDAALCYGWIDGQKKPYDEDSWLQRFIHRSPRSGWSKKNIGNVKRLIRAGRMKRPGLAAVEAAISDGRWESAYDSQGSSKIPEYFLKELSRNEKAYAFFKSLDKTDLYSIAYRLQTARKPETKERRMKKILDMMAKGKKFHEK